MHTRVPVALIALVLGLGLLSASTGWTQDNTEKINAVLDEMRQAIAQGDAEAVGALLSDSGFVAVMPTQGGAECLGKTEFIERLKELFAEGGAEIGLEEIKLDSHWLVGWVSAKLVLMGDPNFDGLVFDAVLQREAGDWKLASLLVTAKVEEPSEEAVQSFVNRANRLPESLKQGDVDLLADAIHDEHFVLCFLDPSGELRWANSETALTQMLQMLIPTITVNESRLDISRTVLGEHAAIMDGTWLLDIPELGQTSSVIRAHAVKVDGQWQIVAIAGGPKG